MRLTKNLLLAFAFILALSSPSWADKAHDREILLQELHASVALLTPDKDGYVYNTVCGGTLIAPDQVLTAAHCSGANIVAVLTYGGAVIEVTLGKISKERDLAIFVLATPTIETPAKISLDLVNGDFITVIGSPGGTPFFVTGGRASDVSVWKIPENKHDKESAEFGTVEQQYIVTDSWLFFGNSGGGAFDADGNLVGVVVDMLTNAEAVLKLGIIVGPAAITEWLTTGK